MEAVEFDTIAQGQNIKIPDRYKDFAFKPLRVILLQSMPARQKGNSTKKGLGYLAKHPLQTKKIQLFSKDELNER